MKPARNPAYLAFKLGDHVDFTGRAGDGHSYLAARTNGVVVQIGPTRIKVRWATALYGWYSPAMLTRHDEPAATESRP